MAPLAATLAALLILAAPALAFLPFQNPPNAWGRDNYNMSLSTLSMFCNASGPLNGVPNSFGSKYRQIPA